MIKSERLLFTATIAVVFSFFSGIANAQQFSCENIKEIVKTVAEDSTLHSITGPESESKTAGIKEYTALKMFWETEGDLESQYIEYEEARHSYSYRAFIVTQGTSGNGLVQTAKAFFKNCLGSGWILKPTVNQSGDSVFFLKNPSTYVVIKIWASSDDVLIDCDNERNKTDECELGDCDSYLGSRHFFNEDIYSGTFLNGSLTGVGQISWYRLNMGYSGSFINNEIAGYGTMYYNGKVLSTGIYFKGDPVNADTAKYTCQYGNCGTGFGLKVIKGGFYAGNFKDSLYDGMGELVLNKTSFYGYFQKNQINGKGIYITAAGEYVFATYANGRPVGDYEKDYPDKTSREANVNGRGSIFDENNLLMQSGIWAQGGFTEYTDAAYLDLKAFATSLTAMYADRKTGFKEIRGEQNKELQNLGVDFYKSKVRFLNAFDTNISADHASNFYITVDISGPVADKAKSISLYNKFYAQLNSALGSRWKTSEDGGPASAATVKTGIVLVNEFDKTKNISLSLDKGTVRMEIH
jgi:hypothetical protein